MGNDIRIEFAEQPSVTSFSRQWIEACSPTPLERSYEEKLELTKQVSELMGRDLLAEGILLTGVVNMGPDLESMPAIVDVTFSYQSNAGEQPMSFQQELEQLINKHSQENGSNTPDFVLAKYMHNCLGAFNEAVQDRELWYGRKPVEASVETVEQLSQNRQEVIDTIAADNSRGTNTSDLDAISKAVRERAALNRSADTAVDALDEVPNVEGNGCK